MKKKKPDCSGLLCVDKQLFDHGHNVLWRCSYSSLPVFPCAERDTELFSGFGLGECAAGDFEAVGNDHGGYLPSLQNFTNSA